MHLSVPVMIRFIVISRLGAAGPASAGFSMAIDLLQRPFWGLNAAIHTVSYPEVVAHFEHGTDAEAKKSTARLFDFMVCATAVMVGGLIGFLPDAGRIFVPRDILESFLAVAPAVTLFYFLHTHLQATLAVIPHLQKSATRLVIVASCQFLMVSAFSTIAVAPDLSPTAAITVPPIAPAIVI